MTGRRRRVLTADEFALWSHVTQHVHPLTGKPRPAAAAAAPATTAQQHDSPARPPSPAAPPTGPAKPKAPPAPSIPPLAPLERRLRQRLSRGSHPIDAVIDLHGMRQDEAHGALRSFLGRAQASGHTVVLVVTGKGGRAVERGGLFEERGVLRRSVPHWLRMPELRSVVVGFEEAVEHHGGAGALYVRLRRRRAPGAPA